MNHHHYNKDLQFFARENRNNATKSEACLWKYALKSSQMMGYPFRRQRPIGNYIVDFVCLPLGLIIEVDGYSHEDFDAKDIIREENLKKLGFAILRFSSWEVLNRIDSVAEIIMRWIKEIGEGPPPPAKQGKSPDPGLSANI
ncbi:MAG: endonuclease domain-containing protein [Saprospiraceae bacterium]|nr:endonuclease domain-containing protein [Candidatus Brachybacter algidus]